MSDNNKPAWTMPATYPGAIVWWYPHADASAQSHPAMVVSPATNSVFLMVYTTRGIKMMDGVRHLRDPNTVADDIKKLGGWESIPQDDKSKIHESIAKLTAEFANFVAESAKTKEKLAALERRIEDLAKRK